MMKVLLRAPILTLSGYGVHSRQVARWLMSKKDIELTFQLLNWGNTPWYLDKEALGGLVGQVMERSKPPEGEVDITVQLQLPNEWDPKLGKFNVGMTAAVESDRCHPDWRAACEKMNLVIVPSEHAKRNLLSNGEIKTPIAVIPESYHDACTLPDDELPTLPVFSTDFNFLVFGQLTGDNPHNDRKNTFFTVRWLLETFKDDPEVGIILKTNAGKNTIIDRSKVVTMMTSLVREIRKGDHPRVHLVHGEMSELEVAGLYRHPQVRALVAATRGEGFGLPILEAAVSGLPIIATDWSGHLDFLKKGKFVKLYYQLVDVHKSRIDNKIFVKGSRWANPSEQDFKQRVMKFRTSPATPTQWATDLQKKLQRTHSFEKISEAYDETFKGVL